MSTRHSSIMTATFTFRNVGQGLFYTGKFCDFKFVYDCGSTRGTHLNSIVRDYKRKDLENLKLDLLILSHLHDDHIAGLNTLLRSPRVSVDTAILPYLSPIERLMVSLKKISLPLWFYDFLADPVSFLIENGVRRVLLLGGSEASPPKDMRISEGRFENREERIDIADMPDDDLLLKEIVEKDRKWNMFLDESRLTAKSHDGYIYRRVPRGVWAFRFFNCRVKDSKLNQFEQCVKPIAKGIDLADLIRSASKRRKLRGCYRKLQKDFNDTSIVAYHSPIMHERNGVDLGYALGQLLTGDINLNQKWKEIRRHFSNTFSRIFLCLVPHHGARTNWSKAVLSDIPKECRWIISSGVSNRYGHPSFEVIQDIIQNGNPLSWSNEINRFLSMVSL